MYYFNNFLILDRNTYNSRINNNKYVLTKASTHNAMEIQKRQQIYTVIIGLYLIL
jgi:hypothetical protein